MSYLDSVHSFPDNGIIIKYLEKAIQYEGLSISSEYLRDDLTDNVCIVLHDGEQFAFLHRSFQEYFSAVFLATRSVEAFADVVDAVARKDFNLAVIKFLFEMNREAIERNYLIPRVKSIIEKLKKFLRAGDLSSALGMFFSSMLAILAEQRLSFSVAMYKVPPHFHVLNVVSTLYGLQLFPYVKIKPNAIEELKKKGAPMGVDRVSLDVNKITKSMVVSKDLARDLKRTLAVLEEFLPKRLKEEAERKTLLSEALLGAKKQRGGE
jgi:hypothetical protein